jgi:hypothetical protein
MHRFGHTANSADGLYFKGFVHVIPEFYENIRARAIPAGGHGLLDDEGYR